MAIGIDEMLADLPLSQVLTSMPGVGVTIDARILIEVGDRTAFDFARQLVSYAAIARLLADRAARAGASSRPDRQPQN